MSVRDVLDLLLFTVVGIIAWRQLVLERKHRTLANEVLEFQRAEHRGAREKARIELRRMGLDLQRFMTDVGPFRVLVDEDATHSNADALRRLALQVSGQAASKAHVAARLLDRWAELSLKIRSNRDSHKEEGDVMDLAAEVRTELRAMVDSLDVDQPEAGWQ